MSPLWGFNSIGRPNYKHSVPTGLSTIEYERLYQEEKCFLD